MHNIPDNAPAMMQEEEINILELLRVIVRQRALIIRVTLVVALISVITSLCMKSVYTAKASILPPQKDMAGGAAAALLGQLGGLGDLATGLSGGGSSGLYMGILKSRSVADAVIQRMDLHKELKTKNQDDTRKKLKKIVQFKAGKDGIIDITAELDDPARAAKLANVFIEELQKKSLTLNLTKAGLERNFLEKRLTVVKQELKTAEESMKNFQEQHKTIKADTQAALAIGGIAQLNAEIVLTEVKLAALRSSMTDESPQVKNLLAILSQLKGQLASKSGGSSDGVIPSVGAAPSIGVEYVRRLRDLKVQEAIFEQLTKQYELAKLNEARDTSTLQVLDEAVPPLRRSKPMRSLIVMLSGFSAFFCSILYVLIREYLVKLSPDDTAILEEITGSLKGMVRVRRLTK